MAKRIRREIVIGGRKQWITAYTEQEYANKLMAIVGTAEERKAMHPFKDLNSTPFVRQYGILLTNGVLLYAKGEAKQEIHRGV